MKCVCCRYGSMVDSVAPYFANIGNRYIIIENVPCKKCEQCGEVVFSSSVMECVDEILERVSSFSTKICVTEYGSAA